MSRLPILNIEQFQTLADSDDFYFNNLSDHIKANYQTVTVPHKHDFFLTVLFTQGEGIHEIDFNSYPIRPGSVFLLNPGQTHHWELSQDINGFIFFHSQSFYDLNYSAKRVHNFPFFYSLQNSPCIYLNENEQQVIEYFFKMIHDEYYANLLMKQDKLCSLIDLIYIELSRICMGEGYLKVSKSNNYSKKLQQLEQLIEQNFLTEKSPMIYADWMNITPKHLNRITKTMVGKTTSDLIAERVLLEAKRMLLHAENNFSEIAYSLGYEDYSYFSRLFKKKCGESPSEFQKRYY
ncbi:AraC family transcriptional regulator [Xanthovirga aplysinae]|uniref:AraC family transcriptional regulator n=1 Tax=Xanthovirga aplysinae TaxID=2529853 RepID=UPI0012BBD164|nr:helix-turn-helix domain-containing protein [Xanthovirga aplysinae]MTI31345.1 helix-turn-helix domain-containing protein [Xanthovirga aplysinae]